MTTAIAIQKGRGKGRNPWRIREFLDNRGENLVSLAAKARARKNVVSDTVRGLRNHARTLEALEAMGCPQELLYPLDYRHEEVAA